MNKKWYSFFELLIVITVISILTLGWLGLFNIYKQVSFENLSETIKLQIQSARNITWAWVTLKNSLLKKNETTWNIDLNKDISRFISDPSYYTVLTLTTQPLFWINSLWMSSSERNTNQFFYLMQYRQEKIVDFENNVKESFILDPDISNQLLKFNNLKFYTKFSYWNMGKIFLNKIVLPSQSCLTDSNLSNELYIVFDYDNLVPRFMQKNWLEFTNSSWDIISQLKLCFSSQPSSFKQEPSWVKLYQEVILNKNTLYNTNNFKLQ